MCPGQARAKAALRQRVIFSSRRRPEPKNGVKIRPESASSDRGRKIAPNFDAKFQHPLWVLRLACKIRCRFPASEPPTHGSGIVRPGSHPYRVSGIVPSMANGDDNPTLLAPRACASDIWEEAPPDGFRDSTEVSRLRRADTACPAVATIKRGQGLPPLSTPTSRYNLVDPRGEFHEARRGVRPRSPVGAETRISEVEPLSGLRAGDRRL